MSGLKEKKKRKKVVISIEEKYEVLQRLDSGETAVNLAKELNVGKSTISDWKKNRKEIEKWYLSRAGPSTSKLGKKRKTMKKSEYEEVGEALYIWFLQKREKGAPLSGPILREKALHFYAELEKKTQTGADGEPTNTSTETTDDTDGKEKFTASDGWLSRWKNRFGIRQLNICGEKLSAENQREELETFKRRFQRMIEKKGLGGDQIYNCDETGLYFRMFPSKSLVSQQEKSAPGFKKSKERVTMLACSNATGSHKLQAVVIGKSKNPRAFKKVRTGSHLPVYYRNQKNAWMNSVIFLEWFYDEFVPEVSRFLQSQNLPRKAILVLDNAPSHPNPSDLRDGDIRVLYLPPNVTSICQPMDQGVLESFKKRYRSKLLSNILLNDEVDIVANLKKVDMLDVVRWVSMAWNEVEPLTIVRSWRKLLDHRATNEWWGQGIEPAGGEGNFDDEEMNREDVQLLSLMEQIPGCSMTNEQDLADWMGRDNELEFTDDDILQLVTKKKEEEKDDMDDDDDETSSIYMNSITHAEALQMFEKIIPYIERQEEVTAMDVMLLRKWRDFAARKRFSQSKQQCIEKFLQK